MKKCVIVALCALALPMLWLMACKKNERAASPAIAVADTLPANPLNPYDSFGYWHNVILDSLEVERRKGKCKDLASYSSHAGRFCKSKGWMKPTEQQPSQEDISQKIIDFTSDPNGFINHMQWSDAVKNRLQGLFSLIDAEGEGNCSYAKLKQTLTGFEQEVLESPLPEKDREIILKATSTARFSGYRWSNQPGLLIPYNQAALISILQQQQIPLSFSKVQKEGPGLFKRVKRWIAVSAMDVMGAVHYLSVAEGAVISGYAGLTMDLLDKFH